jgi:PadR family transcriptional regulator PadR
MEYEKYVSEVQKGFMVIAVLQTLSDQRMYASEMLKHLAGTEYETQEGTLYPLLSRMKREGLLAHDWVESKNGPPRKYYSLSEDGQVLRARLMGNLVQATASLKKLLKK